MIGWRLMVALSCAAGVGLGATAVTPIRVQVLVTVVDTAGVPMPALTAGDFRATSDGDEVPVVSVSTDRQPLALAVVLDTTASAAAYGSKESRRAIADTIGRVLGVGGALKVWIGGLAATLRLEGPFASPATSFRPIVDRLFDRKDDEKFGPSPIWDSLWQIAELLEREPGHRAVIAVTDGKTSGNVHGFADLLYVLCLKRIAVSVIAEGAREFIPQSRNVAVTVRPDGRLRQLSEETGGAFAIDEILRPRGGELTAKTGPLVSLFMNERLHPYTLTLTVDGDAKFHRLGVTVARLGAVVHAPGVYLARQ
jgi:hypothetical protein